MTRNHNRPSESDPLDRDRIWQAIDTERGRVADMLDDLSAEQWRQQSLCAGWTVRDVAAHLTLQQVGPRAAMVMLVKARGNTDRAIHDSACARAAALTTQQIVAEIRGMIGSRRRNFGVTYREPLIDILVHGQDIAVPIGRPLDLPPDAAAAAATRLWTMRWPPPQPAPRRMRGFRLTATDVAWSVGEGPDVRAPIGALLMLGAGRITALPALTGPGADALAARLRQPGTAVEL
jgi:uncharacterized protein (TIGR03083 family)